jgi:cysteinyl-tRNA synthetase
MYSCGPTVYSYQHIGNMRPYVFADTLRRVLEWKAYEVSHVVNITDVGHLTSDMDEGEDKLELASAQEGRSVWDVAAHYTEAYMRDLQALRTRPATVWPRATDHIADMIAFAEVLEATGHAYRLPEGLYFDSSTVDDYGKLALLDAAGLRAGARVAPAAGKRNVTDFALWRASPANSKRLMEWGSPWGTGAPGWHLECSVMSIKYLGQRFDIHTGGIDHIPVHHTNEIAQSEAYLGGPWVPFWLHNEFINLREAKMSKSKGRTLLLSDLEHQGTHPLSFRFFLVGSHYRNKIEFTWSGIEAARTGHRRLLERLGARMPAGRLQPIAYAEAASRLGDRGRAYLDQLDAAVSADLNTPQAVALLSRLSHDEHIRDDDLAVLAAAFEAVLAIGLLDLSPAELDRRAEPNAVNRALIESLLEQRAQARARGDWSSADQIRDQLGSHGIEIRDTPQGSTWTAR